MCMIGQPNEPSLLVMMQFVGQKDLMIIDGLLNSNPRCASDALLTTSDWSVNSFIMVVDEIIFSKFNQYFLS